LDPQQPVPVQPTIRPKRELLRATLPFAQEQRLRSWWHFGSTLALLIGLFGLTCFELPWPLRLAASIAAGLVLVRFFVIYHDYQHGAILRRSRFAELFFTGFGILVAAPRSAWKHSHDYHHHHNAQYFGAGHGTFPLMTTDEYAQASGRQRLWYRVVRHPLTILLGYVTIFLYTLCLQHLLRNPRRHLDAALALVLQATFIIVLATWAPRVFLFTFLIPTMLSAALGTYLFYVQHNFPDAKFNERERWDYVAAALQSSSFLRLNPVLDWITGNIGYHHVHHLNSRIPFYRLPEAMAGIPELRCVGVTSLHPWDVYRCLRLKLWDPRSRRLVPFQRHRLV
jgi:omega-6 fatty acid desaturase (delta-12 desaturase)